MSSGNSYPRCLVELRASRTLFLYIFLLTAFAVVSPWLMRLPPVPAACISLAVLPFSLAMLRRARSEIRKIVWQSDGRWVLIGDRDGNGCSGMHENARILPGIFIGARLLALHWRCDACRTTLHAVLLRDNCDPDALRRLAVRLRVTADAELFGDQPVSSMDQ